MKKNPPSSEIDTTGLQISPMQGEKMALDLFHKTAERVPAYKDFIKKHKLDAKKITTYDDFQKYVPIIDKENYISRYPLSDLCFEGDMFKNRIVSGSSGSSGVPFFWPRGIDQDIEGRDMFGEAYDAFSMDKTKTLLVICFSMGTWIAGTFTMTSTLAYIDQGRPVNIATPGIDKEEAVKTIQRLHQYYEQIVMIGYPPIVKDIIEEGKRAGIEWKKMKTRLFLSSEAFSEEWRDYVLDMVGSDNPYDDSTSLYGSADAGIFGIETPLSILVRRIYNQQRDALKNQFGVEIVPTIVQYDPSRRFFEEVDGELIFTANAGLPLVRYNSQDAGKVMSAANIMLPIENELLPMAKKLDIDISRWPRPFLSVNGRKLFVATIYGVNIYPENIKAALIKTQVRRWVTGRFTMFTKNYSDMDQYFEINVELAHGFTGDSQHHTRLKDTIIDTLLELNAEFHKLHEMLGAKVRPHVHLLPFGDPKYFADGVKHKWIKKD